VSALARTARQGALALLDAGERHRRWTPQQKAQWTRAFNALQRLAGKKIMAKEPGRLTTAR
jgi:hypothetical protein